MRSARSLLDPRFVSQLLEMSHLRGGVADRSVTASGSAHRPVPGRTQQVAEKVFRHVILRVAKVVGQFTVAALYERRNLLNQKPAVIDRRYKNAKVTHYRSEESRPQANP